MYIHTYISTFNDYQPGHGGRALDELVDEVLQQLVRAEALPRLLVLHLFCGYVCGGGGGLCVYVCVCVCLGGGMWDEF
jgi:hypothetical protein